MTEREIPHWAKRERVGDLAWLGENLHVFWPAAERGFRDSGRGALVVDATTLVSHPKGKSNPFFYLPQAEIKKHDWADAIRMVSAYDPTWELVIVLLKSNDRESIYRIGVPSQRK